MLNELFGIIERISLVMIPILGCLFAIYFTIDIYHSKKSQITFKKTLCMFLFTLFLAPVMMQDIMSNYNLAVVWQEYKKNNTLEPYIESAGFTAINIFYVMVTLSVFFVIWYIYSHQIIPGSGDFKTRLKKYLKGEK